MHNYIPQGSFKWIFITIRSNKYFLTFMFTMTTTVILKMTNPIYTSQMATIVIETMKVYLFWSDCNQTLQDWSGIYSCAKMFIELWISKHWISSGLWILTSWVCLGHLYLLCQNIATQAVRDFFDSNVPGLESFLKQHKSDLTSKSSVYRCTLIMACT
jgi:hypothetical protein